jgi:Zn-dependent M28 family amino/carboxypeptidase
LGYDPGIAAMLLQVNESEMYQTTYDLQNFSTRAAHSPGNKQAATYVYNRLNSIDGLKTEYQGGDHRNIISTLQGKNTSSDMIFIVGAHYDSISSNPDKAPGATDNGCGVAIVMELARIMSQHEFNNTVQFAFWNAEESGSSGCRDYVTYAARNSLNIPLYFNFDSSCYDPDNQYVLDIMYDDTSAPVAELLTQYNSLYGINFTLTNNIHTCSGDHLVFRDYGYPAIMTHSKSHGPQAHTENDTIEMMSPHYAKKNAQLGLSVLARLLEIRPE